MDRPVIYEQLAEVCERRAEARQRDVFLALAADAYLHAGEPDQAERLRQKLLLRSPYHLLKPYSSFAEALQSPDVVDYLEDLRHQFPPETAEKLLAEVRPLEGTPSAASSPAPLWRRPAPSPYRPKPLAALPEQKPDAPAFPWVPGVLFALTLLLSLAWTAYVLGRPFLE